MGSSLTERSKTCVEKGVEVPKEAIVRDAFRGEDVKRNWVGRSF